MLMTTPVLHMGHLGEMGVTDGFTFLTARQKMFVRPPEFHRHGVVEDGVDRRVHVDHQPTEQDEPVVRVSLASERIVDDQNAVGHPQYGEKEDDHPQHLHNLKREKKKTLLNLLDE